MKKILSREQEEKKNKKKQIIVGIVLIAIMVLSTFGIIIESFGSKSISQVKYGKLSFENQGGYWTTQKDRFNLIFSYVPQNIELSGVKLNSINGFYSKPLYIYSESDAALREVMLNLDSRNNPIVQRIQLGCPEGQNCSSEIPVKDCTNNFFIIKLSETPTLSQEDHCIIITGNETELVKKTDEALFKIFNIVS